MRSVKLGMMAGMVLVLLLSLPSSEQSIHAFSVSQSCRLVRKPRRHYQYSFPVPATPFHLYQQPSSSSEDSFEQPQRENTDESSSSSSSDSFKGDKIVSRGSSVLTNTVSLDNTVPSYKTIILFVSTTIIIWLCEPLLSLIDATVVGRTAHSSHALTQLAALGPATMLIDSLVYVTYFLSIATTCKMATAHAKEDYRDMIVSSSQVMGVAAILGGVITTIMFVFGRPLLTWCAGDTGKNVALVSEALLYSKIRCSVSMFSIIGMVAQTICLSVQDTKTPGIAVLVACLTNIVGDLLLIPKFGLRGAAIATAVASVLSSLVLLASIRRKTVEWNAKANDTAMNDYGYINGNSYINGDGVNGHSTTTVARTVVIDGKPVLNTTRALNDNVNANDPTLSKTALISATQSTESPDFPFVSIPDRQSTFELLKLAGPIFFVLVGKVLCYSALTFKATNFGVLQVATHNIMMRIFFFHATFGDSLTQAAQTYLPAALLQKDKTKIKQLLKRLIILATGIGVWSLVSISSVLHLGRLFTNNPEIIQSMAQHSSSISFAAGLHGFIMVLEGAIIATGDLTFLVTSYVATMGILFTQLKYATPHFAGIWIALLLFQMLRLVQFKSRVVHKVVLRPNVEASG